MNVEERIAAVRAGRANQTAVATLKRSVQVQQARPEAAVQTAPTTETAFDIANNAIAKVMERGDLTDKGKLEAVVQFLGAKDVNYSAVRKNFAAFEVYFTYAQSKRTQVSEENIQRLMDELADGTKSTVKLSLTISTPSTLQQQALPITASALEMGLQQGVALRDGLLAAGVRDATRKAQDIFGANLEGATGAQTRLEVENLDQMRAAIAALGKAHTLIDDASWKLDSAVIDTKNWGFGSHVLVSPAEMNEVNWAERYVRVELTRYKIKCSPSWKAPDWKDSAAP
jgi:hypothetical protein